MLEHGHFTAVVSEEIYLTTYELTIVCIACIWSVLPYLFEANVELTDLLVFFVTLSLDLTHFFFEVFSHLSLLLELFLETCDLVTITKGCLNIFEILFESVTVHLFSFTIDFPQFFWS